MKITQRLQLAKKPVPTLQSRAIGLLRRMASSPANIFVPGSGYLQALDNKLTYSKDLSNVVWSFMNATPQAGYTDHTGGSTAFSVVRNTSGGVDHRFQTAHTPTSLTPYTYATILKQNGVTSVNIYQNTDGATTYFTLDLTNGAISNNGMGVTPIVVSVGNGYYLVAYTITANALTSKVASYVSMGQSAGPGNDGVLFSGAGVFQGTYTAQQVASLGIPWTLGTASVSLSLGPELVTNGGFADATGWTLSSGAAISGGACSLPSANSQVSGSVSVSASKTYRLAYDVIGATAGLFLDHSLGGAFTGGSVTGASSGSKQFIVTAIGAAGVVVLNDPGSTGSCSIDNISVREIISTACPVYTDAHVYAPGAGGVAVSGLQTSNYTLSDGSTGYSAIDGSTGLVLDGAGSVGAALTTLGTYSVYNSTLTNGGVIPFTATSTIGGGGNYGAQITNGSLTVGQWYMATVSWAGNASGRILRVDAAGVTNLGNTASGTNTVFFQATSTIHYVYAVAVASIGESFQVTACTVQPYTGIHATQPTTANKPALRRGLLNWLPQNQWGGGGTAPTGWTAFGGGGVEGALLPSGMRQRVFTSTASRDFIHSSVNLAANSVYAVAVYVDANPNNAIASNVLFQGSLPVGAEMVVADTVPAAGSFIIGTITTTATAGSMTLRVGLGTSNVVTGSVTLSAPAIFQGTLTAAQILAEGGIPLTTSAAASNPSAGRYWWDFPTAGKGLVLGSPVAQMTDDSWCVVCVNAVSNAADKYIANLGCGAVTQLVSSVCIKGTGFAQAAWVDDGAAHTRTIVDAVNHHGIPTVISAVKRGGVGYLRVNGVQIGSVDLTVMGATTVTAGMIGGFNAANTSNQFVGSMGQPNMGKGTISDADLLTLERRVASQTPAGPVF